MKSSFFRKNSADYLSDPQKLGQQIRAVGPLAWITVTVFIVISIFVAIWLFTGSIKQTVQATGVVFSKNEQVTIFAYLPMGEAKKVSKGMSVKVFPDGVSKDNAFIYGKIDEVGTQPISKDFLISKYGSEEYIQEILPEGNSLETTINLEIQNDSLKWSNIKDSIQFAKLNNGIFCTVNIIVGEKTPYQLIWGK